MLFYYHVLLVALVLASAALSAATEEKTSGNKPNIVVIFGDDVGFGDLASFGHPTSFTPGLDALAARGAKLTQYYSAANICSPSRGSLMTGRLFRRLGVYPGVFSPLSNGGLPLNETTIPDMLRSVGYATGGLGKWHLGQEQYHPTNFGFDFYFGATMTQNECTSNIDTPGSVGPTSSFGPCPIYNGSDATIHEQGSVDMLNIDERYDAAAEGFIRNATSNNKPFFFYFSSHHTHAPQFAPSTAAGSIRGLFGDSLRLLDRSVERITNLLDELEITNNTLVVFSADNGGSLHWLELGGVNGDLRCGKGTTWEGGHRVPTIAMWPGKIAPGTTNDEMMSSLDWFPTFATLAGYSVPSDRAYDGVDISEALFQGGPSPRSTFFYHSTKIGNTDLHTPGALMAVRKGPYKLHFYTQGSHCTDGFPDVECHSSHALTNHTAAPMLYNLERDPGEVVLLSQDSYGEFNSTHTYTSVVADLTKMAEDHMNTFVSYPSQTGGGSADRFPCCSPSCTPRPHCCKCPPTV